MPYRVVPHRSAPLSGHLQRSRGISAAPRGISAMAIDRVDAYLEAHRDDFEEQLKALLRIPSISAQPAHDADTRRAAEFVRDDLRAIGFEAELIETAGHPIVYAERHDAPGKPTLLVYGHYDVQPAGAARTLALAPVRADRARRQPLRPGRHRRQGADVHPPEGRRRLAQGGRPAAAERQDPDRRRGGGRRSQPGDASWPRIAHGSPATTP